MLAGGTVQGWTPDVAVILWRRMLGSLGDINKIKDSSIHASVFDYLCDILETLLKVCVHDIQATIKNLHLFRGASIYVFYRTNFLFFCLLFPT